MPPEWRLCWQAANCSLNLCKISSRNNRRWLVINANLESSWTPVHKLYRFVHFQLCNGCINILRHHISSVQKADGHVFSVSWINSHHLTTWLKALFGYFVNSCCFVHSLIC